MKPSNPKLYASVKKLADERFLAPTSVYKSAWVVREYKKRGGTYSGKAPSKSSGLKRWFREKWVNVANKTKPCGRPSSDSKSRYPLCRPTVRISAKTPTTLKELTPAQIRQARKKKKVLEHRGRISF